MGRGLLSLGSGYQSPDSLEGEEPDLMNYLLALGRKKRRTKERKKERKKTSTAMDAYKDRKVGSIVYEIIKNSRPSMYSALITREHRYLGRYLGI